MATMYDAVNVDNIPSDATIIGAYCNGAWPTLTRVLSRFPHALVVSITVNASSAAHVLDVETGDATPADAPKWITWMRSLNLRPTIYCNSSTWPSVISACNAAGVAAPYYWIANYSNGPVIPPGASAVQYIGNDVLDVSETDGIWPASILDLPPAVPVSPSPASSTIKELQMACTDPTSGKVVATDSNGNLYAEPNALPTVFTLGQHPEWRAGEEESAGSNPCIGITPWKDIHQEWGFAFVCEPASGKGGFGIYNLYHFNRDGTPA